MSRLPGITSDIEEARSHLEAGARLLLVMAKRGGCKSPSDMASELPQAMAFIADAMLGHLEIIGTSVEALEAMGGPQA